MTEENPPNFLGAECYTFADFRQVFGGVVCAEGLTADGDLLVTAAGGASVNVNVGAGTAWVEGNLNGSKGMYYVSNDASKALTIATNGAGSSRIDLIIATVYDSQYIGSADSWALEVVQGVAGAGVPAVPDSTRSGYLILGKVTVPASGGTPSVVSDLADLMVTCGISGGNPPRVDLVSTSGTSCTNNTETTLALASVVHVDTAYFTVASNVVTAVKDCYVMAKASAFFDGMSADGLCGVSIVKNGTAAESFHYSGSAGGYFGDTRVAPRTFLAAGDTLRVQVKQSTGATQTCDGGGLKIWKVG